MKLLSVFKQNKLNVHEIDDSLRNRNLIRQIASSFGLKIISVLIGIVMVPMLLSKLGNENYGVWAVLVSLIQWISLMDVGIGNGLRNNLTVALSNNDTIGAKQYISTAYIFITSLGIILLLFLIPTILIVDWRSFFNSPTLNLIDLRITVTVFLSGVIIYFVLSLINQILNAVQRNALTSIVPVVSNGSFLIILYFFLPKGPTDLIVISFIYVICLLSSIILFSLFFFKVYKELRPAVSFFDRNKIKSILNLGLKFFIIQITYLIIFSSTNMLIAQLFGPKMVTVYNVPNVIFSNIAVFIGMLMLPLFSSYTEAYSKNDLSWIRAKIRLFCKLCIPFVFGLVVLIYLFPYILKIWLKEPIWIPENLTVLMAIYTFIVVWNNIFSFVLGGIGKIRLGMYFAIFQGLINIPLSIFLARNIGMGLNGIILSNIICLATSAFVAPVQVYYFIFSNKRTAKLDKLLS